MIIAHTFLREDRRRKYLYCETTASEGMTPPYPTPDRMFEVELPGDPSLWEERVKNRILAERPDLEFVGVSRLEPSRRDRPGSFDLVFKRKDGGTSFVESVLKKIGVKK